MNQGTLEVVKQDMARLNINILDISELKWTGIGKLNSDDHYIYYCGQEPLRRNGVAIIVNKRVWNAILRCTLKNDRMISVCFQGKPFSITVIEVYAPTSSAEEVERFYDDLQDHPQDKEHPQNKKKWKKAKWLSDKALQIAEKRREAKGKGERKDIPIWMQSSKE